MLHGSRRWSRALAKTESQQLSRLLIFSITHCFKTTNQPTNKKIPGWCYLQQCEVLMSTKLSKNCPLFVPRHSPFRFKSQAAQLFCMYFHRENKKTQPPQTNCKHSVLSRFADKKSTGVSYRHLEMRYLTASNEKPGLCSK